MSVCKILQLPAFTDARGTLVVQEGVLPFEVKRTFWVVNADGCTRGGHRHHVTRQALVAVRGEIAVHVDDGVTEEVVRMSSPDRCVLLEPEHFHRMTFGEGSVMLVFASHGYDPTDYIYRPYSR